MKMIELNDSTTAIYLNVSAISEITESTKIMLIDDVKIILTMVVMTNGNKHFVLETPNEIITKFYN